MKNHLYPTLLLVVAGLLTSLTAVATITPESLGYPAQVEPLITSTWGQRAPYNYMCPLVETAPWSGYDPASEHCRAGCVAVAIAQIMRYHRWPLHGEGTASVTYPLLSNNAHEFSVDFGDATYDYDAMLDNYTEGGYNEQEGRAVAQLIYHCAVASGMIFGQSASATTNFATAQALSQHFNYDSCQIKTVIRYAYTEREWMDMVYRELTNGRPIFYEAIDFSLTHGSYAHSFIIDGYRADGYIHVNWGWNGLQDDYYDISLLNPDGYRFNFYQDMTIGIQSPQPELNAIITHSHEDLGDATDHVYTLDGRHISQRPLPPGLYLRQGRKFVVR